MIGSQRALELMQLSIQVAARSVVEDRGVHPFVGAVLADRTGEVIATSFRGETGAGRHAEFIILAKAAELGADLNTAELFVTLEPCTARGPGKTPCADHISNMGIRRVHIGMLDPNPQILGRGETRLRWKGLSVERFPSELIRELEGLNADFVAHHQEEHLPSTSLYVTTQIARIILEQLQREGVDVSEIPDRWDLTVDDLVQFTAPSYPQDAPWELSELVRRVRGIAFDKKYADYTYERDARGILVSWRRDVHEVLGDLGIESLADYRVIDVGVGNGLEGVGWFEEVRQLTAVDVGPLSLERARHRFPNARALVAEAENLHAVRTASQDVYISLRTYQSSYFDIHRAIREVYRVLRSGGVALLSVANCFLGEEGTLLPGLLVPGTSLIDRDRPFILAEDIRRQLTLLRFEDVGVRSAAAEILIFGRKTL